MKLADLKLNPDNPRNIKPEKLDKLAQSIKDFPKMEQLELIDLPCDQCFCFSCRLVVSIWKRKEKVLHDFKLKYPEYTDIEYHGFYIKAEKSD